MRSISRPFQNRRARKLPEKVESAPAFRRSASIAAELRGIEQISGCESQRRISGCRISRAAQMLETEIRWRSDFSPRGKAAIKSASGGASAGQPAAIRSRVFWTCAGLSVAFDFFLIQSVEVIGAKRAWV